MSRFVMASLKVSLLHLVFASLAIPTLAQKFDEKFEHWPTHPKINGRIVIFDGLSVDETALRTLRRIKGDDKSMRIFAHGEIKNNTMVELNRVFSGSGKVTTAVFSRLEDAFEEDSFKTDQVIAVLPGKTVTSAELKLLQKNRAEFNKVIENGGTNYRRSIFWRSAGLGRQDRRQG